MAQMKWWFRLLPQSVVRAIRVQAETDTVAQIATRLDLEAVGLEQLIERLLLRDCVAAEIKDHVLREIVHLWSMKQPAWDSPESLLLEKAKQAIEMKTVPAVWKAVLLFLRDMRDTDWRDARVTHPASKRPFNPSREAARIIRALNKA